MQYYRSTGLVKKFEWGNALWMDNVDDSVHIPYSPSMDFTGKSFTICFWVNIPDDATTWSSFLANWSGVSSAVTHWSIMLGSSLLGFNARMRQGASILFQRTNSGASITSFEKNKWDFRAFEVDLLGVNGVPNEVLLSDSRINTDISESTYTFWGPGTLGGSGLGYSFSDKVWTFNAPIGSFSGSRQRKYIDTVSFFDRALTTQEVKKIYNEGRGRLPTKIPNCVACYLFDESPGTAILSSAQMPGSPASRIILDHSGNGNHAYAVGYGAGSTDFVNHHTLR